MTRAQELIKKYIYTNVCRADVLLFPIGRDKIKLIDADGASKTLAMNLYGDIMDADTKKIYAVSNLPHDLMRIGTQIPESWEEVGKV